MLLSCEKCGKALIEMEKGKIKNGVILLCANCWEKAKIAINMADYENSTKNKPFRGSNNSVNDLMSMFNFK